MRKAIVGTSSYSMAASVSSLRYGAKKVLSKANWPNVLPFLSMLFEVA